MSPEYSSYSTECRLSDLAHSFCRQRHPLAEDPNRDGEFSRDPVLPLSF